MISLFKTKMRGKVTIRVGRNERIVINQKRNTIAGHAKEIAAKRLIQHASSVIDRINFFQGGTLLHSAPITETSILAAQQVQLDASVAADAFNGTFDKVALVATGIGNFAELTGLSVTKTDVEPLLITWTVKVI